MSRDQKEQILKYFFSHTELPDDMHVSFEKWMLDNEEDPDLNQVLSDIWDTHTAYASTEENRKGLERLHASIRKGNARVIRRGVLRAVSGIAAAVLLFAGGFYTATRSTRPVEEITLLTARGSVGEYTLPDGTKVWLNGESQLKYPKTFSKDSREVALSGEAFFEVERDSVRPFRVNMNNMEVEVLGTSFDAISYDFSVSEEVVIKTGMVKVSGETIQHPVYLRPNEKLSLDRFSNVCSVEIVDAQNYCQWFEPRLAFDNTPLSDIIINLERKYSVEITLSPRIPLDKRLSLVVGYEPLEDILEVLSSLIPVKYRVSGHTVMLTEK